MNKHFQFAFKSTVVVIIAIIFILQSCSDTDCSGKSDEYKQGFASGKTVKIMGGSGSCSSYVDSYNNQTGRNTMKATDCFCSGFRDGLEGKVSKY